MSDGTAPDRLYLADSPKNKADISAIVPATLPPGSPKKKKTAGWRRTSADMQTAPASPASGLATRLPLDRALEQWQNGPHPQRS
jgi:hypothetical protein